MERIETCENNEFSLYDSFCLPHIMFYLICVLVIFAVMQTVASADSWEGFIMPFQSEQIWIAIHFTL